MGSRTEEVLHLYEWCRVVLETLAQLEPSMQRYRTDFMEGLDGARQMGRVAPLREAENDLIEWVHGLDPEAQRRVDEVLRKKFGSGLAEETTAMAEQVNAIVAQGRVKD